MYCKHCFIFPFRTHIPEINLDLWFAHVLVSITNWSELFIVLELLVIIIIIIDFIVAEYQSSYNVWFFLVAYTMFASNQYRQTCPF